MERISLTDKELLSLLKDGDQGAYTEIYDRHYGTVFGFIRKYLRARELAADICQNVFLKFWEQREQAPLIREPAAWLLTIAKRQAIDFLRQASVEQAALGRILANYPIRHNSVEEDHFSVDYLQFINQIVDSLPEQTKQIFRLCRQQHYSYEETAKFLDISSHTVKKHMVRSMRILKNAADNELGAPLLIILTFFSSRIN
jgi:RNA polymerase sigma-70 factor (family 1)